MLELNVHRTRDGGELFAFSESPRTYSSSADHYPSGAEWHSAEANFQTLLDEAGELCDYAPRSGCACFASPSLSSMKNAIGGTWLQKANAHLGQNDGLRVEVCTWVRLQCPLTGPAALALPDSQPPAGEPRRQACTTTPRTTVFPSGRGRAEPRRIFRVGRGAAAPRTHLRARIRPRQQDQNKLNRD